MDGDGARITGRVPTKVLYLDRASDPVEEEVVRDRGFLGSDGVVFAILVLDRATGRPIAAPRVETRGFALPCAYPSLLGELGGRISALLEAEGKPPPTSDVLRAEVVDEVRRLIRRRSGKQPLVTPIIVEV